MNGIVGPNYQVAAYAIAGDYFPSWFPGVSPAIPGGQQLYAEADAGGIEGYPPPPVPALSAGANASVNEVYRSAGPARLGLIEFSISIDYVNATPGGVEIGSYGTGPGGLTPYSCNSESCLYTGTLPFELGTTFQASASTSAGAAFSSPGEGGGADTDAAVAFALFEANGTTPVPVFVTSVPEPSTGVLFLFVSVAVALLSRRSARGSNKQRML